MASSNLFAGVDDNEDIFGGVSSQNGGQNDDLFGEIDEKGSSIQKELSIEKDEDTGLDIPVNGHRQNTGDHDELVHVSLDEVPSPHEAEELVKKFEGNNEVDGPAVGDTGDHLCNKYLSYEERAMIRREQRQTRVAGQNLKLNSKEDSSQERGRRSLSPSPSPLEEGEKKVKRSSIVISVRSRSTTPSSSCASGHVSSPLPDEEDNLEPNKMESVKNPTAQIHQLTNRLRQEHAEKESLVYDNAQLRKQLEEMSAKVSEFEEMRAKVSEFEEMKAKVSELEDALLKKEEELQELKKKKTDTSSASKPVGRKMSTTRPSSADAVRTKVRPGVDKSRPISSVKDSVKKFSVAGSAGSPEVKRIVHPNKEKQKPEGEPGAKPEEGTKARESGGRASSAKGDKPVPSTKKPVPKSVVKKPVAGKTSSAPTSERPLPVAQHPKTAVGKTMEKPVNVSPLPSEPPVSSTENVFKAETTSAPVVGIKETEITEASEISKEQKAVLPDQIVVSEEGEDDPSTRARRVISLFENKAPKVEDETPPWKKQLKTREQQSLENSTENNTIKTDSKPSTDAAKPVIATSSITASTADRPQARSQSNANGVLSAPKVEEDKPSAVEPVKSDETTDGNSKTEFAPRDKVINKVTSAGNLTTPAKQRLVTEDNHSKRSSWAGNKREECATCGKTVYAMERLEADKVVYHKTCFKCIVCKKTLSTGTYAALQGNTYCKVHFKQLFKIKGNYDEGFGREQHKTKWTKKMPE